MENKLKLNSNKEVIAFLARRFPDCFSIHGKVRPLKIGIIQDILERVRTEINLSKTQLRSALRLYTSSWRYLHSTKVSKMRIDLDGNLCGLLDEQHIKYACQQLEAVKIYNQSQYTKKHQKKYRIIQTNNTSSNLKQELCCQKKDVEFKSHKKNKPINKNNNFFQKQRDTVENIDTLSVGQSLKIKIGANTIDATVTEIIKDGIRVHLCSGVSMIIHQNTSFFKKTLNLTNYFNLNKLNNKQKQ